MTEARPPFDSTSRRRLPAQRRSRERVERILDATATLIHERRTVDLSTRVIAARAGVPVASLYQYFADRDEIVLALVERDIGEMDAQVGQAVAALERLSLRSVVETTMRAFVEVYHRRPAFVVIYWQCQRSAAVQGFCREHNRQVADGLFAFARQAGLVRPEIDPLVAELGVEAGDRAFQLAFDADPAGDERVIAEGIELVVAYLERYATDAGLRGIAAADAFEPNRGDLPESPL